MRAQEKQKNVGRERIKMSLKEKIKTNMIASSKQGRELERTLLRTVLGEIQRKEAKADLNDEQIIAVIKKMHSNNLETIDKLDGASAMAERLAEENIILESYLPKTLSVEEIAEALRGIEDKILGAPNDGPAIGMSVGFLKKQGLAADGKDIAQAVKKIRE